MWRDQNRCVVDIVIVLNTSFRKDIVLNKLFHWGSFYSTRSDGFFLTILESILYQNSVFVFWDNFLILNFYILMLWIVNLSPTQTQHSELDLETSFFFLFSFFFFFEKNFIMRPCMVYLLKGASISILLIMERWPLIIHISSCNNFYLF